MHSCNTNIPITKWEGEMGGFLEAVSLSVWYKQRWITESPALNYIRVENSSSRLFSEKYTCTMACVCLHHHT